MYSLVSENSFHIFFQMAVADGLLHTDESKNRLFGQKWTIDTIKSKDNPMKILLKRLRDFTKIVTLLTTFF